MVTTTETVAAPSGAGGSATDDPPVRRLTDHLAETNPAPSAAACNARWTPTAREGRSLLTAGRAGTIETNSSRTLTPVIFVFATAVKASDR